MNSFDLTRRNFLQGTAAMLAAHPFLAAGAEAPSHSLNGRLYKTLKVGMVGVEGSLTDKFKAVKAAGFQGIELNAPTINVEETRKAIEEAGLPVDGSNSRRVGCEWGARRGGMVWMGRYAG